MCSPSRLSLFPTTLFLLLSFLSFLSFLFLFDGDDTAGNPVNLPKNNNKEGKIYICILFIIYIYILFSQKSQHKYRQNETVKSSAIHIYIVKWKRKTKKNIFFLQIPPNQRHQNHLHQHSDERCAQARRHPFDGVSTWHHVA